MTITDKEYLLGKIFCVIQSTMQIGFIDNTRKNRHSECFVYIISGCCEYTFPEKTLTVSKGDVLYLAKNSRYTMNIKEKYSVLYVDFDLSEKNEELVCEKYSDLSDMEDLFRRLYYVWIRNGKHSFSHIKSHEILYGIYHKLCKSVSSVGLGYGERLLEPAIDHIVSHLSESCPETEMLASLCGMSEGHFRRVFRNTYGMPPVKYISRLKLDRACEMLKFSTSHDTFSEISESLGYSSVFYFSKCFKKEFGVSPNELREIYISSKTILQETNDE